MLLFHISADSNLGRKLYTYAEAHKIGLDKAMADHLKAAESVIATRDKNPEGTCLSIALFICGLYSKSLGFLSEMNSDRDPLRSQMSEIYVYACLKILNASRGSIGRVIGKTTGSISYYEKCAVNELEYGNEIYHKYLKQVARNFGSTKLESELMYIYNNRPKVKSF